MSFFDKKIKLTRYKLSEEFTLDAIISKLLQYPASKLDDVKDELLCGWTRADNPASTEIDNSCMVTGEYLYVNMRSAVKKLPTGLFKMLLAKKEAEYKNLNGTTVISSKVKKHLKEEVADYLLPRIVPTVTNTFVIFCKDGTVYAGTNSNSVKNSLCELVHLSLGAYLDEQTIDNALPTELHSKFGENAVFEYMTSFLFTANESDSGCYITPPYSLFAPSESACKKTALDGLFVQDSPEFITALKEGKLFKKVNIAVTGGYNARMGGDDVFKEDEVFYAAIDKSGSLNITLPETESDPSVWQGVFAEKMDMVKAVFKHIDGTLQRFIEDASKEDYCERKSRWISERA